MNNLPKVYIGNIQILADRELFKKAYATVSLYRQQKIDSVKCDDDKLRSLGAGLLLQKALCDFGIDEKTADFETDGNGKPFIRGAENLHFNLSHSGDRAMCVISDFSVGCDVEKIRKIDLRLAERFFHPDEIAQINAQSDEQQKTDLFFKIWTMKESVIKATGLGLKMELSSFSVFNYVDSDNDNEAPASTITSNSILPYKIFPLDFNDGYKYAVCMLASPEKVIFPEKEAKFANVVYIEDFHYI